MVVAVVAMHMVKTAVHEKVDVITMWDSFAILIVRTRIGALHRIALDWILFRHLDNVILDAIWGCEMQVTVMQKIYVVPMPDAGMPTAFTVYVRMTTRCFGFHTGLHDE